MKSDRSSSSQPRVGASTEVSDFFMVYKSLCVCVNSHYVLMYSLFYECTVDLSQKCYFCHLFINFVVG